MSTKKILDQMIEQVNKIGASRREISELSGVSKSWLDKVMRGNKKHVMLDPVQRVFDALDKK